MSMGRRRSIQEQLWVAGTSLVNVPRNVFDMRTGMDSENCRKFPSNSPPRRSSRRYAPRAVVLRAHMSSMLNKATKGAALTSENRGWMKP